MSMKDEYQSEQIFRSSWLGAWESVNGNPDVYIFQGYNGRYYLLAYFYDTESMRGNFSCYEIDSDENGYYASIGMTQHRLQQEDMPFTLSIGTWGDYMKN